MEHKVAAVWTRVSTGKQADNNGSLESQKRICDEYAASKGIRIKEYFGGEKRSRRAGVDCGGNAWDAGVVSLAMPFRRTNQTIFTRSFVYRLCFYLAGISFFGFPVINSDQKHASMVSF